MKSKIRISIVLLMVVFVISLSGFASIALAEADDSGCADNNWSAHTTFHVHGTPASAVAAAVLSPTQVRTAYHLPSTGGSGVIAIVDAFDDPTVETDLKVFSSTYGLPLPNTPGGFVFVKYPMTSGISVDGGWALETSLDVQWAHAIAPSATILLVEASSNSFADLLAAVDYARNYPSVVAVSMSWGGSEFSGEASYDYLFTSTAASPAITFFAASGDNGAGVIWPAASLNVVGVGGTTLKVDPTTDAVTETAWSGSGGGVSRYENQPPYQAAYGIASSKRTVPDVSYNADPNTGVRVYDSTPYSGSTGWWQIGGTSAGAPQWAAIQSLGLSASNNNFYQDAKSASYSSYFRDITIGSNGYSAKTGYDYVTGLGSPVTTIFTPTPDFSISASPAALTIPAGSSPQSSTITVKSLNSFSDSVALTAMSVPTGLTVDVNPISVAVASGGSATSVLKITVPAGVAAGTYKVTLTGTNGSLSHSAVVTVTVPAPVTPDFSISASPSSLTIRAGSSGSSRITVTSLNGFGGTVSVAASAPSGWSASLSPSSLTVGSGGSASSTLMVTVPLGTKDGTYTVTVTATSGSLSHTATVTIKVSSNGQGQH